MLYVSLWKIALSNLPGTRFTKRAISTREAATLISEAREEQSLLGVSSTDLGAPYESRAYDLHRAICEALRVRGVGLVVDDFFYVGCSYPLGLARVDADSSLLVIDCGFKLPPRDTSATTNEGRTFADAKAEMMQRVRVQWEFSPDSLAFYLFEDATP